MRRPPECRPSRIGKTQTARLWTDTRDERPWGRHVHPLPGVVSLATAKANIPARGRHPLCPGPNGTPASLSRPRGPQVVNTTAGRGLRATALGRKTYLFLGSGSGGKAAAIASTPIDTAEPIAIDPHAWLKDTLALIPDSKPSTVDELLPWRGNAWRSHRTVGSVPASPMLERRSRGGRRGQGAPVVSCRTSGPAGSLDGRDGVGSGARAPDAVSSPRRGAGGG
ncbi:MAG: transposase domain-containing protein [Alkalilacustris sp.]